MDIYLPVAEMSVHWLIILCVGGAVGFISGMFGIGGGFLLTPLLIFFGIPPGVAVATSASQVTASTFSGVLTHWRKRTLDLKMGAVMLAGGLIGTAAGVWLFGLLERLGQSELSISLSYVILLGSVGGIMLNESLRAVHAARSGTPIPARKSGQHNWIHGLPFKLRFRQSRLYISAIPVLVLGFAVGVLSAVMGVGGGFVMVPVMIYLLRMPTNIVVGTSLFQVLFVTAASTVLHAINDYSVDIMLALLLITGGVIGVQFGVRMGERLRGEHLRLLLAILVLGVAVRLLIGLVVTPSDIFSVEVRGP